MEKEGVRRMETFSLKPSFFYLTYRSILQEAFLTALQQSMDLVGWIQYSSDGDVMIQRVNDER